MEPAKAAKLAELWRNLAAYVLLLQSTAGFVWWLAMVFWPEIRPYFVPQPEYLLWAFLVPDLALFIGAGLAAGLVIRRRPRLGYALLLVHAGGTAYAALYAIGLAVLSGSAWPGALAMTPPLLVVLVLAWKARP